VMQGGVDFSGMRGWTRTAVEIVLTGRVPDAHQVETRDLLALGC
jgi:hypothetical protein